MIPDSIRSLLIRPTPHAWTNHALLAENRRVLLIDQANCEKKAASTAISLSYRYVEDSRMLLNLSRIAREELRHFEYIIQEMGRLQISYEQLTASRYAKALHSWVRTHEPAKLVDTLLVCAFIEARSCERLACLENAVGDELQRLYARLFESESRHFMVYLELAQKYGMNEIESRMFELAELESDLVVSEDQTFRFHSGVPIS